MTGPPPEGSIKTWQVQLGVRIDGMWGPVTQAAYDQRIAENAETERHYSDTGAAVLRPAWHGDVIAAIESMESDIVASYGRRSPGGRGARDVPRSKSPMTSMPGVKIHTSGVLESVALVTPAPAHVCKTVPVILKTLDREHVADLCPKCDAVTYLPWCYPQLPVTPAYSQPTRAKISTMTSMTTMIETIFTTILRVLDDIWNGMMAVLR